MDLNVLTGLMTFFLGGVHFAIDLTLVKEVATQATMVPSSKGLPGFVAGYLKLREMEIPVVDIKGLFTGKGGSVSGAVIVVSIEGRVLGFVVDDTHDIDIIDPGEQFDIETPAGDEPFKEIISAFVVTGGARYALIDLNSILSDEVRSQLLG